MLEFEYSAFIYNECYLFYAEWVKIVDVLL